MGLLKTDQELKKKSRRIKIKNGLAIINFVVSLWRYIINQIIIDFVKIKQLEYGIFRF